MKAMSVPTAQATAPGGAVTAPLGSRQKMATVYYDAAGRRHRAAVPVPVDQFGAISGSQFRCRRCKVAEWFPAKLGGVPACGSCGRRMEPLAVRDASALPWQAMVCAVERPLRPVWALAGGVAAGFAVDAADVPAVAFVPLAAAGYVAGSKVARRWLRSRGRDRLRDAVDRAARACGYTAAAGTAWLTLPAAVDLGAAGPAGHGLVWSTLLAAWGLPAATWWRTERDRRNQPPPPADEPVVDVPQVDPDEAKTRAIWAARISSKQGQQVVDPDTNKLVTTDRAGRLVGTWLEEWHRVVGGWAATIVGPPGVFTGEMFMAAQAAVASAFRMKTSMITVIPDGDDENRAMVLAQRSSPIKDDVRWAGPDSIDTTTGVAPVAVYADGDLVPYEMYRPNWGVPHVAAFGGTGSGKSEFLNTLFTIDRWAHHVDEHGQPHGIVANFLIDPQQGQSFAPFLDDLAAPVATTLEEAMVLAQALTAEMIRRNRYLARVEWWDERRGRMRRGRKWWNPLVDGPILSLTIDEAHAFLSDRTFCGLVTGAGRMWRKCGGQLRIATHTPLLSDLGGSMALRDMLTSAFVWIGRVSNSLSGPVAFNGRLPVDPRSIPQVPGTAYIMTGAQPKPMLARTMWEPDYYDWVRDEQDRPVGFPAVLPQVTVDTFGAEYARWVETARAGADWVPDPAAQQQVQARSVEAPKSADAVLSVLAAAPSPLDMDELDAALNAASTPFSTRTVRDALKRLRDQGLVFTTKGRHELTPQARAERDEVAAVSDAELAQLALDEGGDW